MLLMVCALVDALHCPKICNNLIAIAILLYYHYTKSSGESSEHVINTERDNLLDFAKCHRFQKNESKWLAYAHLALIFWSENEGASTTRGLSWFQQNWLCGKSGDADLVHLHHVGACRTRYICGRPSDPQTSLGRTFKSKHEFKRKLNFMVSEL